MKRVLPLMTMLLFILGQGKAQIVEVLFSQSSKCVPSTVNFTNNSANRQTLLSIRWNWGDGTPDFVETVQPFNDNPCRVYMSPGTYKVTVTLEYPAPMGFKIDTSITIEVVPNPVFTFSMDADTVCPGDPIQFSSVLTSPSNPGDIQSYFWDFGSGQSSTQANPTNSYENPQNIDLIPFSTSLVITDKNGCQSTVSGGSGSVLGITYIGEAGIVRIWRKPDVDFQTSVGPLASFCVKPGAPPELVTFVNQTDNKTVPPLTNSNTYVWDFGDGGTSNLTNPTHSFGEGYWNVTLTATSPRGCVNAKTKGSVSVVNFEVLHSASKTVVLCDTPAVFTIQGENIIGTSYFLDFNDMHTERMGAWSPKTHIYRNAGTYTVTITGTHPGGQCSAKDTIIVHAYKPIDAAGIVTDTNMCEKDSAVYFRDVTKYNSTDDFGKYNVAWSFGGTGSPAQHVFGSMGNYVVSQTVTTPYGCVLEPILHNIHIFPIHAVVAVIDPALPESPHGCAPHSVTLASIQDSLMSSSPISSYVWRWHYTGNPSDTTAGITDTEFHIYTDTGKYDVYLTLTNAQGCVHTMFVDTIMVGNPPLTDFTFTADINCKSTLNVQVKAYDSLNGSNNLAANVQANAWSWLDDQGYLLANGDAASISPNDVGNVSVTLVSSHNGCPTNYPIRKTNIGYVCPPIAKIDYPANTLSGQAPVYCDMRTINFASASEGAVYMRWYAGDSSADTANQSKSPIIKYDAVQGTHQPNNGNWQFAYDSAGLANLNGNITITLWAMNDSSVTNNPASEYFNLCGRCEHTAEQTLIISDAQMRLAADKYSICQGDSVNVYDSSICTVPLIAWNVEFISATDPGNLDYPLNTDLLNALQSNQKEGFPLYFTKPNIYDVVLTNKCALGCLRTDTMQLTISPRSVPAFTSSKTPNGTFRFGSDTLCLNNPPDSLYLKDASYTPSPFTNTVNVVGWKWSINKMLPDTSYDKNPVFVGDTNNGGGRSDVILTVTNDKGCDSTIRFDRYISLNQINASFQPVGWKEFCNKNQVVFRNLSSVLPSDLNKGVTKMACTWDFGDGTPKYTDTIISENTTPSYVAHRYYLPNLRNVVVVSLTVSAIGLSCEHTFTDTIYINRPIADFTQDENEFPCPGSGIVVSFKNLSQGAIKTYEWNFGDTLSGSGNMSAEENPIHTYKRAGFYDVSLVVEDSTGCIDSMVKPRHIRIDGPAGEVTYSPLSGCVPFSVRFYPNIMLDPNDNPYYRFYSADTLLVIPDGGTVITKPEISLNMSFSHPYLSPGAYLPYFYLIKWVETSQGKLRCVVEWQGKDTVWAIDAHPNFTSNGLSGTDTYIEFKNTTTVNPSLLADSIHWDYGNGTSSWIYNPRTESHNGLAVYRTEGFYTVTLTQYYKLCTRDTTCRIEIKEGAGIVSPTLNNLLRVYPNPTTGLLTISIDNGELAIDNVEIYNVVGQNVLAPLSPPEGGKLPTFGGVGGGSIVIDISHLPNGMYFLKVGEKTVKVVKY